MTDEQLIADAIESGAIVSHYNGTYGNRQEASYKFTDAQLTAFAAIISKRDNAEIEILKSDLAIQTLHTNRAFDDLQAKDAEIARLREALQNVLDGNYPRNRDKKCDHDKYSWEDCEQCIGAYIEQALAQGEQK
jgi:hypothetical protein